MGAPRYLLERLARHGPAALRLINERRESNGEFHEMSSNASIAFDAADFVWAFVCLEGPDSVQETRYIRNAITEAIIEILDTHVSVYDLPAS